jgi:hypothetical protein
LRFEEALRGWRLEEALRRWRLEVGGWKGKRIRSLEDVGLRLLEEHLRLLEERFSLRSSSWPTPRREYDREKSKNPVIFAGSAR